MEASSQSLEEGLVQRCPECNWCFFEHALLPEQRKKGAAPITVPKRHIHLGLIEQLCGKNYDFVCAMKDAARVAEIDYFMVVQEKALEIFKFDLGKIYGPEVNFNFAGREWTTGRDMGRGFKESFAGRFRYLFGLLKRKDETGSEAEIIATARQLYEITVAGPEAYCLLSRGFDLLRQEYLKRDAIGKDKIAG